MTILSGLLALLTGTTAHADTRAGIEAYKRGDYPTAVVELEKAAESGDAQAYFNLGILYADGRAVPKDQAKAVAFYKQGAERGSVLAAFNLAQGYRKGEALRSTMPRRRGGTASRRSVVTSGPATSSACFTSKAKA